MAEPNLPGYSNAAAVKAALDRANTALQQNSPAGKATLISAFCSLVASKSVRLHVYGNSIAAQLPGFLHGIVTASDGCVEIVKNDAVGGTTSTQVLANILANGIDSRANVVTFLEGNNDIGFSVPFATMVQNRRDFIEYVIAQGAIPYLIGTPPTDNDNLDLYQKSYYMEKVLADEYQIPFFDPWAELTDTDHTWTTGATLDGSHPLYTAGEAHNESRYKRFAYIDRSVISTRAPTINTNPCFLDDGNADGKADTVSSLGYSETFSMESETFPIVGNSQVHTAAALSSTAYQYVQIIDGYSEGDSMTISGYAWFESNSGGYAKVYRRFVFSDGTPNFEEDIAYIASVSGPRYFESTFVMPANVSKVMVLFAQLRASYEPTSASFIFKFANVGFRNNTTALL